MRGLKLKKIIVGLKRVIDYNVRVRVKSDKSGVEKDGVKMSINPFDEIALEEALRIKEKGLADEIIVVSIGSEDCQQQLRTGLAMGADRAILVETSQELYPLTLSKLLLEVINDEQPLIVLLGKQAIDNDNNQVGQMLAALWDRPQATFASKIDIDGNTATVTREVDTGLETIEIDLPGVITADLRLNEPRYVKLPDIMKAKKKPLNKVSFDEIVNSNESELTPSLTESPAQREKGIMVNSVTELVAELKNKGLLQ